MSNRYTQLSFSNMRDLALPTLPYEQLDQLLSSTQNKVDTLQAATELTPDYIRESADDRRIASQMIQYQQGVKDQLDKIAASGNTSEYLQALSQATNQIAKMYKPGGPADILKQRKLQDEAEKKRLHEFYKDNPAWADYAIKNRQYNQVGYDPTTGSFNPINTFGNTPAFISGEKFDEFANRNIDNIKDSILFDEKGNERKGIDKYALDKVQTLYDLQTVKGVTYDRIMNALVNALPQEYVQSIYHGEKVNKFYDPARPELDERIFVKDDKGNMVPNLNNPIAKRLHGYATGAARIDVQHHVGKYEDILGIEEYKSSLKKQEIDYENKLQFQTLYGRISGNTSGMTDFEDVIDESGRVKVKSGAPKQKFTLSSGFGFTSPDTYEFQGDIKDEIKSGNLERLLPGITSIYNNLGSTVNNMTSAELAKTLKSRYTELKQHLNTTDVQFEIPSNKKAVEQAEAMGKIIIGTKGALGTVGNTQLYVYDQAGGIQGKPMNIENILAEYNLKPEEFTEQAKYFGSVISNNPVQPSGNFIQLTTKSGKVINLLSTPESEQSTSIKSPSYILASPQFNVRETSAPTHTGIAQIDSQFPMGIFSRRKPIYQSDVLKNKIALEQQMIMSGKKDRSELQSLTEEHTRLLNNPSSDKLVETQIELYDAANPNVKVGDQNDYNTILHTLEQKSKEVK